jgi:hypothetical protein
MIWPCKLCGVDFKVRWDRSIICVSCFDRVSATLPQYLSVADRLWGFAVERHGCWEFVKRNVYGRANYIRVDRRQVPPSHVALHLSGSPRPSSRHIVHHAHGASPLCVNPDHLSWVLPVSDRGTMWTRNLSPDDLARYHEARLAKRAEHQRNWRRRVKKLGGTRSVREARDARDLERAHLSIKKERDAAAVLSIEEIDAIVREIPKPGAAPGPHRLALGREAGLTDQQVIDATWRLWPDLAARPVVAPSSPRPNPANDALSAHVAALAEKYDGMVGGMPALPVVEAPAVEPESETAQPVESPAPAPLDLLASLTAARVAAPD